MSKCAHARGDRTKKFQPFVAKPNVIGANLWIYKASVLFTRSLRQASRCTQ